MKKVSRSSLYNKKGHYQNPHSYDILMCGFETKMCETTQNKRAELKLIRTTHKIIRTVLHYHFQTKLSIAEVAI